MKCLVFFLLLILPVGLVFSQLEKVIVEKYYVSDAKDTTDLSGGKLPLGSTTYRIYIDMESGFVLKKLFGDKQHPFIVKSTENFFNHSTDGQSFAKDFVKSRYGEGLIALDSWLTLGQTTKTQGSKTYFGIPKHLDEDGSFIGGKNNDGGSNAILGGLLTNAHPSCGRPLTTSDGMDTMTTVPSNWFSAGVKHFVNGQDSTIFGSITPGKEYNHRQFELRNSGAIGKNRDSNQVLIAQLTTLGEISFKLNLEIEGMVDGVLQTFRYVGTDSVLLPGETYHPFLVFPLECGCNNPNYLEFNPKAACLEKGSCITPLVYGCMDAMACNFDPKANFNVQGLCCYPGLCNGRDIAQVCPSLLEASFDLEVYPNPSSGDFVLNVYSGITDQPIYYEIFNAYGVRILSKDLPAAEKIIGEKIAFSGQENGLYHLKARIGNKVETMILVKSN